MAKSGIGLRGIVRLLAGTTLGLAITGSALAQDPAPISSGLTPASARMGAAWGSGIAPAGGFAAPTQYDPMVLPASHGGPAGPGPIVGGMAPPVTFGTQPGCAPQQGGNGFFVSFGWLALQRGQYNNSLQLYLDLNQTDTGDVPAPGSLLFFSTSDFGMPFANGATLTFGVRDEFSGCEFSGFLLSTVGSERRLFAPGQISALYTNPPAGFDGDPIWLNADAWSGATRNTLGSAAINLRCWSEEFEGKVSAIVGIRYIGILDNFVSGFDDDGAQFGPDPLQRMRLDVGATNRLFGPQVGLDADLPCGEGFGLQWMARLGYMCNIATISSSLERGDGFVGFNGERTKAEFAQVYETGANLCFGGSGAMLKVGYNVKWFIGVAKADNNLFYDLGQQAEARNTQGTLFYHGPSAELQFTW